MEYNGFTIKERVVKTERGEAIAYEIKYGEYILGICQSIERAKTLIDLNGQRWIKSMSTSSV